MQLRCWQYHRKYLYGQYAANSVRSIDRSVGLRIIPVCFCFSVLCLPLVRRMHQWGKIFIVNIEPNAKNYTICVVIAFKAISQNPRAITSSVEQWPPASLHQRNGTIPIYKVCVTYIPQLLLHYMLHESLKRLNSHGAVEIDRKICKFTIPNKVLYWIKNITLQTEFLIPSARMCQIWHIHFFYFSRIFIWKVYCFFLIDKYMNHFKMAYLILVLRRP